MCARLHLRAEKARVSRTLEKPEYGGTGTGDFKTQTEERMDLLASRTQEQPRLSGSVTLCPL